jgi:hypothetical protein
VFAGTSSTEEESNATDVVVVDEDALTDVNCWPL